MHQSALPTSSGWQKPTALCKQGQSDKTAKKKKGCLPTTTIFLNLKSNTMKNTVQKYYLFPTCANICQKNMLKSMNFILIQVFWHFYFAKRDSYVCFLLAVPYLYNKALRATNSTLIFCKLKFTNGWKVAIIGTIIFHWLRKFVSLYPCLKLIIS